MLFTRTFLRPLALLITRYYCPTSPHLTLLRCSLYGSRPTSPPAPAVFLSKVEHSVPSPCSPFWCTWRMHSGYTTILIFFINYYLSPLGFTNSLGAPTVELWFANALLISVYHFIISELYSGPLCS